MAARIMDDPALAERLAATAEAPLLLRSAEDSDEQKAADAKKREEREGGGIVMTVYNRLVSDKPLPTYRQMKIYSMQSFIPFVGFGFCDNFIMILAGDFIDARLGVAFGISTLAAAGIGNTISDVCGLWLSSIIETAGVAMGLPTSGLTTQQRMDIRMIMLRNTSTIVGMVLGCILGMCPLLFPKEWRLWESRATIEEKIHNVEEDVEKQEPSK